MNKPLLEQITHQLPSLSPAERKVAQLILEQTHTVADAALGLSRDELVTLAKNSIKASFLER